MRIAASFTLLFCCLVFSTQAQPELTYERPVSRLPSYHSKPGRLKAPGCAQTAKQFQVNALELYKAQHPSLIHFTYPEAITPQIPISWLRTVNGLPYHILMDSCKSCWNKSFSCWAPHTANLDYLWEKERKVFGR